MTLMMTYALNALLLGSELNDFYLPGFEPHVFLESLVVRPCNPYLYEYRTCKGNVSCRFHAALEFHDSFNLLDRYTYF